MGMFDSIIITKMWCPFCGSSIENEEWQSKDGDCTLARYGSLEEFGATIPESYSLNIVGSCRQCKEYISLSVFNKSKEHELYAEEQIRKMHEKLTNDCTKNHPNHKVSGSMGYKPWYWNVWCSICTEKGYKDDVPNPEMDPLYVEACEVKAKQDYLNTFYPPEEKIAFLEQVDLLGWEKAFKQKRDKTFAALAEMPKIVRKEK